MNSNTDQHNNGWVPVKLFTGAEDLACRWLYVGQKAFTEPFFDDTIAACRMLPENSYQAKSMSSTAELAWRAAQVETIEPTAFIFHISRCGSTLISQLLGMQPSNIVLSEVPFFDDLLRYGKKHDRMQEVLPQLKAAIALYAAKRNEKHERLFIKTDSWHIHFYKELRALYPHVPFFLLYRKPAEVLRSQQKKRGMQALPNFLEAAIFGFDEHSINSMQLDEYMSMVIEGYLAAFLDILQKDKQAYAVNYHDGAMPIVDIIAQHTGLTIAAGERSLMENRSGFHAKFPDQLFSEEQPEEPIPAYLQRSVELYHELEQFRAGQD